MNKRWGLLLLGLTLLWPGAPALAEETVEHASAHEGHSIGDRLALYLEEKGLPKEVVIVAISTLPIVELRGAVPAGHHLWNVYKMQDGRDKARASVVIFLLSVAGNMIPIPLILLLLGPLSRALMRFRLGRLFFEWLFARTRRKSAGIEKYETLGLAIFVAIPLPVTGGWTGAMAAFLMGIKFHHAMWSILLGVMAAGIIMTTLSLLGWIGAIIAGVALTGVIVGSLQGLFRRENRPND